MPRQDAERTRIFEDLRGLISGEVRCDPLFCGLYASDAGIVRSAPLAVVRPATVRDVIACVQYAADRRLPLTPRGAGTGTAGGAVGNGIILDMSRFFRSVRLTEHGTCRVGAGAAIERINHHLQPTGRYFPWGSVDKLVETIGGIVSTGQPPRFPLLFEDVAQFLVSAQIVLADGCVVELKNRVAPLEESFSGSRAQLHRWLQLGVLLRDNLQAIMEEQHHPYRRRPGYRLWAVLGDGYLTDLLDSANCRGKQGVRTPDLGVASQEQIDREKLGFSSLSFANAAELAAAGSWPNGREASFSREQGGEKAFPLNPTGLFVGSEGTLGIITEVEILLPEPLPAHGVMIFYFESLQEALRAVQTVLGIGAAACRLVDGRHLSLDREGDPQLEPLIPREAQFACVVEVLAPDTRLLKQKMHWLRTGVRSVARPVAPELSGSERWDRELLLNLSRPVPPALYRLGGEARPVPFMDDVAVPPESLEEFLPALLELLRRHNLTAPIYCSLGDGRVVVRPIVNLRNREDQKALLNFVEDLCELVLEAGGSVTCGGGWGLIHSPFLVRQCPRLVPVMEKVKESFDPRGILNPGKVIGSWSLDDLDQYLRSNITAEASEGASAAGVLLGNVRQREERGRRDSPSSKTRERKLGFPELVAKASICFSCGGCRHQLSEGRMCPVFRSQPTEEASPRAKANLLRYLAEEGFRPTEIASGSLREIADLCVHCHMCTLECPARVDIPGIITSLKGEHVDAAGLWFSDWVMARLDRLASWGMRCPRLTNRLLRMPWFRWILEKVFGIAQGRFLPPVADKTFLELAKRSRLTRISRQAGVKVAYFVDVYVNWFAPRLGQWFLEVLQHNGISVHVPEKQLQAGVPAITVGALHLARRFAVRNIRTLANLVRQGFKVLGTEPAAVLALRKEYPQLLPTPDATLVASQTFEACTFLWQLHLEGKLQLDFRPVPLTVGYHQPCRMKALGVGRPGEHLLQLIPGLQVLPLPDACSGMAGTFGLKASHYRASLRAGFPLIVALRNPAFQIGVTECSACRIQLEQGAGKPVLHPLELLACAYGFVELESLLRWPRS
jgi:FAD/FMN-containing dehydrogenase/Fe-S oxidoreductase